MPSWDVHFGIRVDLSRTNLLRTLAAALSRDAQAQAPAWGKVTDVWLRIQGTRLRTMARLA